MLLFSSFLEFLIIHGYTMINSFKNLLLLLLKNHSEWSSHSNQKQNFNICLTALKPNYYTILIIYLSLHLQTIHSSLLLNFNKMYLKGTTLLQFYIVCTRCAQLCICNTGILHITQKADLQFYTIFFVHCSTFM